jgi:hypothetical protein
MTDLQNPEKKNEVMNNITIHFIRLLTAYDQCMDEDQIEKSIKIIVNYLQSWYVSPQALKETYDELIGRYTHYRKVCSASYIEAYHKVNIK